jgi:uncharacterized BrkB/YihY/UPF0761 family membrane protein
VNKFKAKTENVKNSVVDTGKRWYHKLENVLRLVVIPGFKGMPLYDVLVFFLKSFTKGRLMDRAAAVAFNFFLALFPLVLFFFTLIPYIPIPHLYERIMDMLGNFLLPSGTLTFVTETIDGIMNQPHEGLLSVSILLCFIFGTSGVSAIFNGFKNAYLDYGSYGWLKQRLNSALLLVLVGLLVMVSIALISFGDSAIRFMTLPEVAKQEKIEKFKNFTRGEGRLSEKIITYQQGSSYVPTPVVLNPFDPDYDADSAYMAMMGPFPLDPSLLEEVEGEDVTALRKARTWMYWVLTVFRWLLVTFIIMLSMSLLYYLGNVPKERYSKRFKIFTPGSILATGLFILATIGFNVYIRNFSRYNALYGSIGTLIILLMWLWVVAIVILCGNDLNMSIKLAAEDDFDNPIVKTMKAHINQRKERLSKMQEKK